MIARCVHALKNSIDKLVLVILLTSREAVQRHQARASKKDCHHRPSIPAEKIAKDPGPAITEMPHNSQTKILISFKRPFQTTRKTVEFQYHRDRTVREDQFERRMSRLDIISET
jgi:hypothetical protein